MNQFFQAAVNFFAVFGLTSDLQYFVGAVMFIIMVGVFLSVVNHR